MYSQSTMNQAANSGLTRGVSVYTYKSDDNLAEVITAGYFTINPRFTFTAGDIIIVQLGDGYEELEAVNETSAVVA